MYKAMYFAAGIVQIRIINHALLGYIEECLELKTTMWPMSNCRVIYIYIYLRK